MTTSDGCWSEREGLALSGLVGQVVRMGNTMSAMEWLADAALDPAACAKWWRRHQPDVVLLPAGRRWDVVITPERLGFAILRGISTCRFRPGPVLLDTSARRTGFFVPPGATTYWFASGIRCASQGTWIATPWPCPKRGRLQWLVLPDGKGYLNDLSALEHLLHNATAHEGTASGGAGEGL